MAEDEARCLGISEQLTGEGLVTGLVALTFRSLNLFMRPFVQMPSTA